MELPRNRGSSAWSGKCDWGISSDLFLSPFPPSRARTKLSSSLVIQRKVVTRNRKEKAATALPSAPGTQTNSVTHSVTHPRASTSWTHEANMLTQGAPPPTTSLAPARPSPRSVLPSALKWKWGGCNPRNEALAKPSLVRVAVDAHRLLLARLGVALDGAVVVASGLWREPLA